MSMERKGDICLAEREDVRNSIRNSTSTKRKTYINMNPNLISPKIYTNGNVPEYQRIEFSRFRLSSHNLRIETGRWSRIARENRFCSCEMNAVQTEDHVALECPLTADLRRAYNISFTCLVELFENCTSQTIAYIYKVLKLMG